MESNVYDVTDWAVPGRPVSAHDDIGAVLNSIIADVRARQTDPAAKPGAVIYIPPGDYTLATQVLVDVSYLTIKGSGHGFSSLSIRYNTPDTSGWAELNPGGSHIRVQPTGGGAAFRVARGGSPRLSGIVFQDFCLDGVAFTPDQNSYRNGRVGIEVATDNDAFRITGMGFVYLERALVVRGADALSVHHNFIAECGSCVELTGAGQATGVTDNLVGAGPEGFSILAENHEGLLVTGNNVFPRGGSLLTLTGCNRSSVTANRFQGFYPGMIEMIGGSKENLFASNHLRRTVEGFPPFLDRSNGRDDLYGVVHVVGDNNLVTGNLIAYDVAPDAVVPAGARPRMIVIAAGDANVVATNHVVSNVPAHHVALDASTTRTRVLDSGTQDQVLSATTDFALRPTP